MSALEQGIDIPDIDLQVLDVSVPSTVVESSEFREPNPEDEEADLPSTIETIISKGVLPPPLTVETVKLDHTTMSIPGEVVVMPVANYSRSLLPTRGSLTS